MLTYTQRSCDVLFCRCFFRMYFVIVMRLSGRNHVRTFWIVQPTLRWSSSFSLHDFRRSMAYSNFVWKQIPFHRLNIDFAQLAGLLYWLHFCRVLILATSENRSTNEATRKSNGKVNSISKSTRRETRGEELISRMASGTRFHISLNPNARCWQMWIGHGEWIRVVLCTY